MKIKTVSSAKRCEICHQADRFDLATGICSRCRTVEGFVATTPGLGDSAVQHIEFQGKIARFRNKTRLIQGGTVGIGLGAVAAVYLLGGDALDLCWAMIVVFSILPFIAPLGAKLFGSVIVCPYCKNLVAEHGDNHLGRFCPECAGPMLWNRVPAGEGTNINIECRQCRKKFNLYPYRTYLIRFCCHCGQPLNEQGF